MQISILKQVVVLNAFSAAAATDIQTNGSYLYIGSAGTTYYVPRMYYPNAQATLLKSQLEVLSSWLVTGTVGNSTAYSFNIIQKNLVTGQNNTVSVVYNSDTTATDAEIAAGLSAYINAVVTAGGLKVAVSGAAISTGITIVGLTGYPPLYISAGTNTTVANNRSFVLTSTAAATPMTFVAVGGTFVVGQVVTIAGASADNGTYRLSVTNGSTIGTVTRLDGGVVTGLGSTGGTIATPATMGTGLGAQVAALNTTNEPTLGTAITADKYSVLYFDGAGIDSGVMTTQQRTMYRQTIYFDEAGANYAAFYAGLVNLMNGLAVGGAAAESELYAALA